jgi:hypothetical protein
VVTPGGIEPAIVWLKASSPTTRGWGLRGTVFATSFVWLGSEPYPIEGRGPSCVTFYVRIFQGMLLLATPEGNDPSFLG